MESKTSKVRAIQSLGTQGAYYTWEVEMENGDVAKLFKKNNNPWIEQGQEVEYEMRQARNAGELPGLNIKRKIGYGGRADSSNYSGREDRNEQIKRQWAIKCAAVHLHGQNPDHMLLLETAKMYVTVLESWDKDENQ